MKKVILAVSLALNAILATMIVVVHRVHRSAAFQSVSAMTIAEVGLQEHFIKELDSGDSRRIEAVKETMRRNIQNGKQAAATWAAAAK
ncbi:MAG: hypothetical protein EPN23_04675 [Verrucomicrobia bacterium]|nr:MAG: hypothetical protein EPN23_04675 [Verrucomicrobiota bacterium]